MTNRRRWLTGYAAISVIILGFVAAAIVANGWPLVEFVLDRRMFLAYPVITHTHNM